MRNILFMMLFGALALGCGARAQVRADVAHRAAFDFSCPENSIAVTPLTKETLQGADQYGAEGCGRRAVYVRTPSGYVLNTASGQAEQAPTTDNSAPPATASQGTTP